MDPQPKDLQSMKMLVAAVVARACEDLKLGRPFTAQAREWFEEGEPADAWSFEWCCAILNLDPDAVRQEVMGRPASQARRGGGFLRVVRP